MAQPTIDWRSIRPHGNPASNASGFEELSSLLLTDELLALPEDATITRFGNPDGGREGRVALPDGTVIAWQSKYLFTLGAPELTQITKSFQRAVENEPTLTDYYVLLPYDLPGGDTAKTESAHTKWLAAVATWEQYAADHGLSVAIHYVGEHQLTSALTQPSQAGRRLYWFDQHTFTPAWFQQLAARVAEDAGPRYSPDLHVDLPIAQTLDALAQTPAFDLRLGRHLAALRKSRRFEWRAPKEHAATLTPLITSASDALDLVDAELTGALAALPGTPAPAMVDATLVAEAQDAVGAVFDALRVAETHGSYVNEAASLYTSARKADEALYELASDLRGVAWQAARQRTLLITGEGGTGKTHLLCDVAASRAAEGLPTLIVLGQHLDTRPPLTQITERVQFAGSVADLLPTLNAAAEAVGRRGLVIIDALNESDDPRSWPNTLSGLRHDVLAQPWLTLVVSCRTTYRNVVLPERYVESTPELVHVGLAEQTDAAVARYLDAYGIDQPTFPPTHPELSNPLFLRLLCESLRGQRQSEFPRAGSGMTAVYGAYLTEIDRRLSSPDRCDYDATRRLAYTATTSIAGLQLEQGAAPTLDEVRALTDALHPVSGYSRALLKGLLDEGVLIIRPRKDADRVQFGYERLGDIICAELVCAGELPDITDRIMQLCAEPWRNAGVLEQLTVVLPERHGVELVDLLQQALGRMGAASESASSAPAAAGTAMWKAMPFRSSASVTGRTVELAEQMLASADDRDRRTLYAVAVQLATIPDHPMNAQWLHHQLLRQPLVERDSSWTQWCNDPHKSRPMQRLLDWAWSSASDRATPHVRLLAAVTLSWALTSTRRPLRDQATKAIISVLEGHPDLFAQLLREFADVDDPYVTERLLAVGAGLALRSPEPEHRRQIGAAVLDATVASERWPTGLLARDYARRAIEAGLDAGMQAPEGTAESVAPPYLGTSWPPTDVRTQEQIEALTDGPAHDYLTIRMSVIGRFGDFNNYVMSPALGTIDGVSPGDEDLFARTVFDRTLAFGWTEERFGDLDKGLRWEPSQNDRTERIGKKYQWIAFHDTLAALLDAQPVLSRSSFDTPRPYDNPSELDQRDLDPTLLLREGRHAGWDATPTGWLTPHDVDWSAHPLETWLADVSAIPDPADLLIVNDPAGSPWVTLEGHYRWKEPVPPEDDEQVPERAMTLHIRAFTFPAAATAAVATWVAAATRHGLPDSPEFRQALLADYPTHPTWALDPHDWYGSAPPPAELSTATVWSMGCGSYDCSSNDPIHGLLPSRTLIEALQLTSADEFRWLPDGAGEVAAADFAVRDGGPASLHAARAVLLDRCLATGTGIVWTVHAEKSVHHPSMHHNYAVGDPVDVAFRATYVLDAGDIRLVAAAAVQELAAGAGELPLTVGQLRPTC